MDGSISFELVNGVPRLPLAHVPTPLIELRKLSALMKGPRIFMKREDLTGFAMGGNKVRKFEYFMADALGKGADCCIAIGAIQSNHARVAAAAALHCGLKAYLLLMGEKPLQVEGNLLLDYLLGAEITYVPKIVDFEGRLGAMLDLSDRLRKEGRKPYVLPVVDALGCLGPFTAMEETIDQAKALDLHFSHQFVPVGSGETLIGLALGAASQRSGIETIGVCIGRDKESMAPILEKLSSETKGLIPEDQIKGGFQYLLADEFLGVAGHSSKEGLEAIRLVARTEGIFLDPIYTGKAMAAVMDLIKKRRFRREENLLFWNTSSSPIFFSFDEY